MLLSMPTWIIHLLTVSDVLIVLGAHLRLRALASPGGSGAAPALGSAGQLARR